MAFKVKFIFQRVLSIALSLSLGAMTACQYSNNSANVEGINRRRIRLGSVLALKGQEEALGNHMKAGLKAALAGEKVQGKTIELIFKNDFYDPLVARQATQALIDSGIFLMIGNVGTPTAKETLPILRDNKVPAIGFFTGAALLRKDEDGIVNYRASYSQEIATVIEMALNVGVQPGEICAYVQNDSYGISGLEGLRDALFQAKVAPEIISSYERVLEAHKVAAERDAEVDLNGIGPIGVYTRNTPYVLPGYESLKQWEKKTGTACKLIITAGTYSNIARFVKKARDFKENWVISALSFTSAKELQRDLEEYGVTEKVIMTQVVPLLTSNLPILEEAKAKVGDELNYVSLEGYIVGKMTLKILREIPGQIDRDSFLQQVSSSQFDLSGVSIDFTQGRPQASDLVKVSILTDQGFEGLDINSFADLVQ